MTFPAGWTQVPKTHTWDREVEPTAAALTYALMTLPAATIMLYADGAPTGTHVTRITYHPGEQEAILS